MDAAPASLLDRVSLAANLLPVPTHKMELLLLATTLPNPTNGATIWRGICAFNSII